MDCFVASLLAMTMERRSPDGAQRNPGPSQWRSHPGFRYAPSGLRLLTPHLPPGPQEMIRQHTRYHRFADRHGADADAGIVAAFCHDVGIGAPAIDGAAPRPNPRGRVYCKPRDQRPGGGNAAQNAAGVVGQEADALIAAAPLVGVFLAG